MPETDANDPQSLAKLRDRIDVIDAELHRLLVDRGTVIDALIKAKGTDTSGAAFRPGREADMMRRLVARHEGHLPLATIEHIWREIITTFTRMQAPFDVAIDVANASEAIRDLARFYFGFSVNLVDMPDPAAVIARVAESGGLGVIAIKRKPDAGAWWRGLATDTAPRIIALLPHIQLAGRPADVPAYVISSKLADPTPPEIRILALAAESAFSPPADSVVLETVNHAGLNEVLLAVPAERDTAAIAAEAGGQINNIIDVGGTARGIVVDGEQSLLHQKVG